MSNRPFLLYLAVIIGALLALVDSPALHTVAVVISELFINLLKLISLPLIFLSMISVITGMKDFDQIKNLGGKVLKYTLFTTVVAATTALLLFLLIDPVGSSIAAATANLAENSAALLAEEVPSHSGYITYLIKTVPSNFLEPFIENHVIGVLFLALLFSAAILKLPQDKKELLHTFFSSLYSAVMVITGWIVALMPIAVAAMVFLFALEISSGKLNFVPVALYLFCVLLANFVQAFLFLPALLKVKGIAPLRLAKAVLPALSLAFFSKSSSAALPSAMGCAAAAKISSKTANFSLPLCTTVNMNACAAFILTTVLFVSMSSGVTFTPIELVSWVFIATLAAFGNAGVPMGCFFLASALLAAMDVPLTLLTVILPFYNLMDMFESAINIWSDICVTAVVDKECKAEEEHALPLTEYLLEGNNR